MAFAPSMSTIQQGIAGQEALSPMQLKPRATNAGLKLELEDLQERTGLGDDHSPGAGRQA
jgi:hypothetical protein